MHLSLSLSLCSRARALRVKNAEETLSSLASLLIINKPLLSPRLFYVRVLPRCILMRVAAQEARITSHDEWREVEPAPSNNTREVAFPHLGRSNKKPGVVPALFNHPGSTKGERGHTEREREVRAFFTHTRHPLVTARNELASAPPRGLLLSRRALLLSAFFYHSQVASLRTLSRASNGSRRIRRERNA